MLVFHWLATLRARRSWLRKRSPRRRRMRRSVLGFHWFRRRPRGRHRLKGPRPQPLQSIEACESRLMPGTLLGSAIDPLAGALSLLWTSDRDPGIEQRDPLPKSSGQTPDAKSESDFTSALSSDTKGSGVSRPDPSAATGNEGTPSARLNSGSR